MRRDATMKRPSLLECAQQIADLLVGVDATTAESALAIAKELWGHDFRMRSKKERDEEIKKLREEQVSWHKARIDEKVRRSA